jgi:hypothetical protein
LLKEIYCTNYFHPRRQQGKRKQSRERAERFQINRIKWQIYQAEFYCKAVSNSSNINIGSGKNIK